MYVCVNIIMYMYKIISLNHSFDEIINETILIINIVSFKI